MELDILTQMLGEIYGALQQKTLKDPIRTHYETAYEHLHSVLLEHPKATLPVYEHYGLLYEEYLRQQEEDV